MTMKQMTLAAAVDSTAGFERYRGLAKNANRVFTSLAMVNLYMAARRAPALVRP